MVLLTFMEVFDIVVMSLVVGFIFKDVFRPRQKIEIIPPEDYLKGLKQKKGFKWNNYWFAVALVAPSIILHEFGHKFVALSQGMAATFNAAYTWLGIGVVLKLISAGFIFFVPAYVSIIGEGTPLQFAGIAFAGPAVNLVLWLVSLIVLKTAKLSQNAHRFFYLFGRINMFLFIFNMLPIPGFDGFKVYTNFFTGIL